MLAKVASEHLRETPAAARRSTGAQSAAFEPARSEPAALADRFSPKSPTELGARAAAVVAILVVLLAVVAIGASSSVPLGKGGRSNHAASLVFTLLTVVGAVVVVCCLVLVVLALVPGRHRPGGEGEPRRVEGRKLAALLVLLAVVAIGVDLYLSFRRPRTHPALHPVAVAPAADQPPRTTKPPVAIDQHVLIVSAIVIGTLVVALAIATTLRRALLRRNTPGEHFGAEDLLGPPAVDLGTPADAAGVLAGITIADPGSEPDPRRAVLVAYERMHDALSRAGYAREPFETPHEYLSRVLQEPEPGAAGLTFAAGETAVEERASRPAAIATLTELFSIARYSSLPMDEADRLAAIDALSRIASPARADHDDQRVGSAAPR